MSNRIDTRDQRPTPSGTRPPIRVFFALLVFVLPAFGQAVVDDPAVEELRQRVPAGANDERTIDQWLAALLQQLIGGANHEAAKRDFLDALRRVRQDQNTKQAFRDALATRLGVLAKSELDKGPSLPNHAAGAIVRALLAADHPGTVPGLSAALAFPDQTIRYFGAAGLQALRDRIGNDLNSVNAVIATLRKAGTDETNGVVVERIYRAVSFPNATAAATDAITATLTSRIDRYRKGAALADAAELAAFDYLSRITPTQPQAAAIIRLLAVLLRLDVERYVAGVFATGEKDAIELRIDACESLIERLCGCTGGNVRGENQTGGPGAAIRMQLELDKWIGVPQESDGVLNAPPWNVPPGAP